MSYPRSYHPHRPTSVRYKKHRKRHRKSKDKREREEKKKEKERERQEKKKDKQKEREIKKEVRRREKVDKELLKQQMQLEWDEMNRPRGGKPDLGTEEPATAATRFEDREVAVHWESRSAEARLQGNTSSQFSQS